VATLVLGWPTLLRNKPRGFRGLEQRMGNMKLENIVKKISIFGIVLGFLAGALVAMISGTWILWLSLGLAIGVLLGSAGARWSAIVRPGNLWTRS
jgi:hypothetical protein